MSNNPTTLVNPVLQRYETIGGSWAVTAETRFVVSPEDAENVRLGEVVALVVGEFAIEGIPSATPLPIVFGDDRTPHDVSIALTDEEIPTAVASDEAYQITISDADGVAITAASENAVLYALRTVLQIMLTNHQLPCGTIVDYPVAPERRLHVDAARKFISKDWFLRQIHEMSWVKMNALQYHFSENHGFRIECTSHPEIVSDDGHLTKADVADIVREAHRYGIRVIPSFDSPGHTDYILKKYPQYRLKGVDGRYYDSGIDITNPEAKAFFYELMDEYADFFRALGCTDFHIGADEYMQYDKEEFQRYYAPVLTAHAQKTDPSYTWKDAVAMYINELAEHLEKKGYRVRIYNDGVYSSLGEVQQHVEINPSIGIDYWSTTKWIDGHNTPAVFYEKKFTMYNLHGGYFYYVLREKAEDDANGNSKPAHSFDYADQERRIWDSWSPRVFAEYDLPDDSDPLIGGCCMCVWCDYAHQAEKDQIHLDIADAMRTMACKAWNPDAGAIMDWNQMKALIDTLGSAPA